MKNSTSRRKPKPAKECGAWWKRAAKPWSGASEEPLTDLAIIAAAQRVEHYEISAYGTARAIAQQLGQETIVSLLDETEEEEKAADSRLTEIAIDLLGQASTAADAAEDGEDMDQDENAPPRKSTQPVTGSRRAARS